MTRFASLLRLSYAPLAARARRLTLAERLAVLRQRRQLASLDAAALKDMGLTEADVAREAKRPVWDVPSNWRG